MSNNLEIAMSVKLALEDFQRSLTTLNSQFDAAMAGVAGDAKGAGDAMDAAFKTLGVRSVREVEAEIQKLQTAMATLRTSKMLPADAERASAALNARLIELRAELRGTGGDSQTAARGVTALGQSSNDAAGALGQAAHKAAAWGAALVGLNNLAGLAGDIINTGAAFQTLEGRLTSLLGSQEAASAAFADLKQLAASSPFEVAGLTEAYAKLTAFGLQPSMEQMQAMADTAATLGGGTETLSGVTTALGQAWAKGKLQGEEILQMAERGVPIWSALEDATGKNTVELQRLSEAGMLGRDVILKLIDALGQQNMGASEQLMNTYAGAVANATDALSEFYAMIADSGVLDYLTAQIRELLAEFERMKETGELQAKAQAIADTFLNLAEAAKTAFQAISTLAQFMDEALALFAASKLLNFVSALTAVKTEAVAAGAAATVMGGQVAAAGASAATAGSAVGLLAGGLRALKVLTLAGLATEAVSLAMGFMQAKREADEAARKIEAADRELQKLLAKKEAENGAAKALEESAVAAEAARFKLSEVEKEFMRLLAAGQDTGKALEGILKNMDVGSPQGIADMITELERLKGSAQVTGDEIQTALVNRLQKLSTEDLRDFGIMAEMAFNRGEISAKQLGNVMDSQVRASLKNLGVDADVALTGMSAGFMKAADNVDIVISRIDYLKEAGVDVGNVLAAAMDQATKAASSTAAVEEVIRRYEELGKAGLLAGDQMVAGIEKAQRKLEDLKPGVNSLEEAFRQLGLKSPQELQKVADSSKQAFEEIKRGTEKTEGGLKLIGQAFIKYAEAALQANGGVVTDAMRVEAAMAGVEIKVDGAGKAMFTYKDAAEAAGQGSNAAAAGADKAAAAFARQADSALRAAAAAKAKAEADKKAITQLGEVKDNGDGTVSMPKAAAVNIDMEEVLYQMGASTAEAQSLSSQAMANWKRDFSTRPTNAGEPNYDQMIKKAAREALETSRAEAETQRLTDMRTRGRGETVAPPVQPSVHRVDIHLGGRQQSVNVASEADAAALTDLFKRLEADSARSN